MSCQETNILLSAVYVLDFGPRTLPADSFDILTAL